MKSILTLSDDPSDYINYETSLEINTGIALKKVTEGNGKSEVDKSVPSNGMQPNF